MASAEGVRFSDKNDEFEPEDGDSRQNMSPEMEKELRNLSMNLQKSKLQASRLENFAFEPVSLPPSRVPSPSGSRPHSGYSSPKGPVGQAHPLTPAATKDTSKDGRFGPTHGSSSNFQRVPGDVAAMTPQRSPHSEDSRRKSSGPPSSSFPPSRESSPPSSSGRGSPSIAAQGDANDRRKRSTQPRQSDAIDPRSIFNSTRDAKRQSVPFSEQTQRPSVSSIDNKAADNKHHGGLFGHKRHHVEEENQPKQGSMSDLKRFFHIGGNKKDKKDKDTDSKKTSKSLKAGYQTPPIQSRQASLSNLPFADDHGIEKKYGKFGKVLGSGAGGSVRLMKRSSDGVTFAVKQFRPRHNYETEKEYNKKVTAEFCIGSTLHHGNIIETMDIVHEKGSWYEVMEYAPFDLFATVMTGKMSKEEVTCCTMQILSGVRYLHGMGLAHRDLKLDNVVISEHGIMKLIDFGSAVVYRYPFEDEIVRATGIVGSDPYLAPEVYDNQRYDPTAVDIWSLAIIYCCMTLRRFPWKAPRLSDVSYKLFVSDPTPGAPGPEHLRRPSGGASTAPDIMSRDDSMTAPDTRDKSKEKQNNGVPGADRKDAQVSVIKGPWRLLRLLPRESRAIMGRMLELDPNKRATLEEVYADKWVADARFCRQGEGGAIIRAPGHTHTLEPGAAQPK